MRSYSLFALFGVLAVSGCNAPNAVSPPLKFTISGKPLKVDVYYSINPDCTSLGSTTIRLIEQPKHGTVEFRETTDFPYFREGNSRAHCNTRRVPVTQVIYIPAPGYTGPDSFQTDAVFPSGSARTAQYKVEVR
jgi:hypothetical protein